MKCTDNTEKQPLTRHQIRMKKRRKKRMKMALFAFLIVLLIAAAGSAFYYFVLRSHEIQFEHPFAMSNPETGVYDVSMSNFRGTSFSDNLCVTAGNVENDNVAMQGAKTAAIMNLNEKDIYYAKNIFDKRYPASLTKIMTALVAIKYGNLDDMIEIDYNALDIDPDSSVCYLQLGDHYTLRQLIYGLLIASGNDAANAIAYHVAGSEDAFVALMNEEARKLGATQTHFVNAHGLQDENHYTTAYDIYLMFNEAMKYDIFSDAINQQSYTVTYQAADGYQYERTWFATNYYFAGLSQAPYDVTIFGGKTGTTDEAGACLSLLSKDPYGNSYFSIIMNAETKEILYEDMNEMLELIVK